MPEYEVLVATRGVARPRQMHITVDAPLNGRGLMRLLAEQIGADSLYLGRRRLQDCARLPLNHPLVLTEISQGSPTPENGRGRLKLYVAEGPDAGAHLTLSRGTHQIGRGYPLRLSDPKVSRIHAVVEVDDRSMRLYSFEGHQILLGAGLEASARDGATLLRSGNSFQIGDTVLQVGDPAISQAGLNATEEQLRYQAPNRVEPSRLIALCAAALVPLLTGVLLAVLTGSYIFLAISGLSAIMGMIPAVELISQRRRWLRSLRVEQERVRCVRTNYAAPLGQSLIAAVDRARLSVLPAMPPPLVIGSGLWELPDAASGNGAAGTLRSKRSSLRQAIRDVPVFAPLQNAVWQIVEEQNAQGAEILAALLARFLPHIAVGRIKLIIDPSLTCLPPQLLLVPNVHIGSLRPESLGNKHARLGLASPTMDFTKPSSEPVRQLYLTHQPTASIPETLVIVLNASLQRLSQYWFDPDASSCCLPDDSMKLERIARLRLERFDRIVQSVRNLSPVSVELGQQPGSSTERVVAELGLDQQSAPVMLDLDADGPHILICGTTGSGKSEALRRIIVDLAQRYEPNRLSMVLIDFKGGAGLAAFSHLPHVQLLSTDLDTAEAHRMLSQLEFEVARRERLLAEHECSSLAEYQVAAHAPVLPRLVVVVDEFRVLIESLPEASARMDRLAAVGRSLGIHLILSTQRAAGTLTGQTRANVNTVIALRLKDPAESVELTGSTRASELTKAGSAVLTGSERKAQEFRFARAAVSKPAGRIFERGPNDLTLKLISSFGSGSPEDDSLALSARIEEVCDQYLGTDRPPCPFSPALPEAGQELPAAIEGYMDAEQEVCCGQIDRLERGRTEPLHLRICGGRGLVVHGVPEAGGRSLLEQLAARPINVLGMGTNIEPPAGNPNFRQVDGTDHYDVKDALDMLSALGSEDQLLIMVSSVAELQSQLDPATFQRLDQVLCSLLKRSAQHSIQLVVTVDRDQNLLKAASLCAEQWYLPAYATDALRMAWPKLTDCSPFVGRGIGIEPEGGQVVFQLTQAPTMTPVARRPQHATVGEDVEGFVLGRTTFSRRVHLVEPGPLTVFLAGRGSDRIEVAEILAQRWQGKLYCGVSELEQHWREVAGLAQHGILKCVVLVVPDSADPRLPTILKEAAEQGLWLVLFVPPSPRLPYDLGLTSMALDERQSFVIEPEHALDIQPLTWPPLSPRAEKSTDRGRKQWRVLAYCSGQVRAISVVADLPRGSVS